MKHARTPLLSFFLFVLPLAALASGSGAQSSAGAGGRAPRGARPLELWVSGYHSNTVHRFDPYDGTSLGDLGNVRGAQSIRGGRGGYFYVVSEKANKVRRFRGTTLDSDFVSDDPLTPADETGGLDHPTAAVFGPDGSLYVASFEGDEVLRYDGATGAFLDVFVAPGTGGLDGPDAGMVFGPDGHLYVPSFYSGDVLRFDGASGALIDAIVPAGRGGLANPRVILFRDKGRMIVTSWGSNRINEYTKTGLFVRRVADVTRPTGLALGPDGNFYVTSDANDDVLVVDPGGGVVATFVPTGGAGIDAGTFTAFVRP